MLASCACDWLSNPLTGHQMQQKFITVPMTRRLWISTSTTQSKRWHLIRCFTVSAANISHLRRFKLWEKFVNLIIPSDLEKRMMAWWLLLILSCGAWYCVAETQLKDAQTQLHFIPAPISSILRQMSIMWQHLHAGLSVIFTNLSAIFVLHNEECYIKHLIKCPQR